MNPKQIMPFASEEEKQPTHHDTTATSPECNLNLPLALLHLISLAPSRA